MANINLLNCSMRSSSPVRILILDADKNFTWVAREKFFLCLFIACSNVFFIFKQERSVKFHNLHHHVAGISLPFKSIPKSDWSIYSSTVLHSPSLHKYFKEPHANSQLCIKHSFVVLCFFFQISDLGRLSISLALSSNCHSPIPIYSTLHEHHTSLYLASCNSLGWFLWMIMIHISF